MNKRKKIKAYQILDLIKSQKSISPKSLEENGQHYAQLLIWNKGFQKKSFLNY